MEKPLKCEPREQAGWWLPCSCPEQGTLAGNLGPFESFAGQAPLQLWPWGTQQRWHGRQAHGTQHTAAARQAARPSPCAGEGAIPRTHPEAAPNLTILTSGRKSLFGTEGGSQQEFQGLRVVGVGRRESRAGEGPDGDTGCSPASRCPRAGLALLWTVRLVTPLPVTASLPCPVRGSQSQPWGCQTAAVPEQSTETPAAVGTAPLASPGELGFPRHCCASVSHPDTGQFRPSHHDAGERCGWDITREPRVEYDKNRALFQDKCNQSWVHRPRRRDGERSSHHRHCLRWCRCARRAGHTRVCRCRCQGAHPLGRPFATQPSAVPERWRVGLSRPRPLRWAV